MVRTRYPYKIMRLEINISEADSPVNRFYSPFHMNNGFIFINITKGKVKNPLFLQPNRSFDFGMNLFISILFLIHICFYSIKK